MLLLTKIAFLAEQQRTTLAAVAISLLGECGVSAAGIALKRCIHCSHGNEGQIRQSLAACWAQCHQQQQPPCSAHSGLQQQLQRPSNVLDDTALGQQAKSQLQEQQTTRGCSWSSTTSMHSPAWVSLLLQQPHGVRSRSCSGTGPVLWLQADLTAAAARSLSTNSTPHSSSSHTGSSGDASSSAIGGRKDSTWVQRYLPQQMQPYAQLMRLEKPIGSWLLAWPGLWSIALAAGPGHLPDLWLSSLFGVGAVVMRGAGCTINDLWDRDIDRRVERTRARPLAAGIVSARAALVFLGAQLSLGLAILLQLNSFTQALGVASLGLVVTYPLMKRVTFWPQAFLGLTFNYGVIMGWAAVRGGCDWGVVLPMYLSGVAWTLVYDTIYAHQDKRDDALVGVKSTALLFGERTKGVLAGFAAAQTAGLLLAGGAAGVGAPYYAAVVAAAAHQAWQLGSVDLNNGPDCMAKFVSNKWYGALIYTGIVSSNLLA